MNDQQKTPWGVWIVAGLVVLLVAYPLSIGPVGYVVNQVGQENLPPWFSRGLSIVYDPLRVAIYDGPEWLAKPLFAYLAWWVPPIGET